MYLLAPENVVWQLFCSHGDRLAPVEAKYGVRLRRTIITAVRRIQSSNNSNH